MRMKQNESLEETRQRVMLAKDQEVLAGEPWRPLTAMELSAVSSYKRRNGGQTLQWVLSRWLIDRGERLTGARLMAVKAAYYGFGCYEAA